MPYVMQNDTWIALQVPKVRSVLSVNMAPDVVYTAQELLMLCANLGLKYTVTEYTAIGAVLVVDGFLQVV